MWHTSFDEVILTPERASMATERNETLGENSSEGTEENEPGFTPELVDHVRRPRNIGRLEVFDAVGEALSDCGHDELEFTLLERQGTIKRVGFVARCCVHTLACASAATTLVAGKTPLEARQALRPEAIDEVLGGLPSSHAHCAELAATALRRAIDSLLATANEPWKRLYRS